jgi:hypothetical protein
VEIDPGVQTAVKTLSPAPQSIPITEVHTYGADIGPLDFLAEEGGANGLRLQFARVGGVEYGEPTGVATEGGPPVGATALAAFPNPASDAVTLALTLDRPRSLTATVYDVLGRRVALLHEGPLPAGDHRFSFDTSALPAGMYYVRVGGGRVHATASVTIIR